MSGRYTVQRPGCGGRRTSLDPQLPVLPPADRVHETELLGTSLLAQQVHLVAEPRERLGQLALYTFEPVPRSR